MECFYINLASATERRERIERSFASNRKPGWSLTRVDAITTDIVEKHQVPGRIRAAEKACLLSHTLALGLNKGSGQPFLVLDVRADANLSHRADPIVSQGWKPGTEASRLWVSLD